MRLLRAVVWSEKHPQRRDYLVLLTCGHVAVSDQHRVDVFPCAECTVYPPDFRGPFDHWHPLATRPVDEEYN